MSPFKFKSIKSNLTYWFLVLSLLPLLVALIITYYQRVNVIERTTFDKLSAIRDLKVERLNDWLNERKGDMNVIAGNQELRALENILMDDTSYPDKEGKIKITQDLFIRSLRNYNVYNEIFLINAKTGKIEISTNKEFVGQSRSKESYFKQALLTKNLHIKDIHHSQYSNKNEMILSIPVFGLHKKERIIGILVGIINLDTSLYQLLGNTIGLGETGETLIVNEDGLALNKLRWNENALLKLRIKAQPAVKGSKGEKGIIASTDYRDEPVLAAFTYIHETGWGFVCKQDMREINIPIRKMMLNFLILFLISGTAILLMAIVISKSISRPILHMNNVAKKIKSGDYSERIQINSRDELGSLSKEFNNMANMTESKIRIQLGISDISKTMIGKHNMKDFGSSILKRLMKITNADMSAFYILNRDQNKFLHFASIGAHENMLNSFNATNPQGEFGNAISAKSINYLKSVPKSTKFKYKTIGGEIVPEEIITIPILIEDEIEAIISLVNIHKFEADSIEIIKQSWTNINTSYSNLIASEKTRILAEHLSGINQQLESKSEQLLNQTEELQSQTDELHRTTAELQQQNIELNTQRKQVELANKLKSEFLSNMSHELRTPLNSIMALSRVLLLQANQKLNEDENNYLEIIERNGKQLLELINGILDLSKIEAGKMEVLPRKISIASLLEMIRENILSLVEEKGLAINLIIPPNLLKVETDEARLHQVLLNIIGNAVKFTEKGGVDVSCSQNTDKTIIEIKDSGIGISEEALPHIFEEFMQVDGSSSRKHEGTGLGLTIAKKMIEILGGTIKATSKLGEGSNFTVIIPTKWPKNLQSYNSTKTLPNSQLNSTSLKAENTHSKSKLNKKNKKKILIIDKNPDSLITIKAILKDKYNILTAPNKKEGLYIAEKQAPDLLLIDVSIPGMTGIETLRKLKTNEITKNIFTMAVTASAMKGDREKILNEGFDAYTAKPFNPDKFQSKIEALLRN